MYDILLDRQCYDRNRFTRHILSKQIMYKCIAISDILIKNCLKWNLLLIRVEYKKNVSLTFKIYYDKFLIHKLAFYKNFPKGKDHFKGWVPKTMFFFPGKIIFYFLLYKQ